MKMKSGWVEYEMDEWGMRFNVDLSHAGMAKRLREYRRRKKAEIPIARLASAEVANQSIWLRGGRVAIFVIVAIVACSLI